MSFVDQTLNRVVTETHKHAKCDAPGCATIHPEPADDPNRPGYGCSRYPKDWSRVVFIPDADTNGAVMLQDEFNKALCPECSKKFAVLMRGMFPGVLDGQEKEAREGGRGRDAGGGTGSAEGRAARHDENHAGRV